MNSSAFIPCFFDHLFFVSDFCQLPCRYFLQFFQFFSTAALTSGIFECLRHRKISFCSYVIFVIPVRHTFHPHRFVGTYNTSIFGLPFPNIAASFARQIAGVLQGIAAGIGISNFLRAFFMVCLNHSSFGSMKKIPRNLLALSNFGFLIAHFCFAFVFAASDICFHICGHTLSGLEVVCFLESLSPDHVYPSSGFSFNKMKTVEPVHESDNYPSTFQ